MKRRSFAGPLLLILIGFLFLSRNVWPGLISFEAVARYWPLVLVVWGVLRLVEILAWRLGGKPLPASGVTSGEWVLVVFICLIGSGVSAAHRHGPLFMGQVWSDEGFGVFGQNYDFPIAVQKPAGKATRLVLENLGGNTRIVGGEVGDIKVDGRKTIRSFHQQDAADADRNTPLEIVTQEDQILVRLNQAAATPKRRVSLDLDITVPRGLTVQTSGRYENLELSNMEGNVEVDVKATALKALNIKGRVQVLGRSRNVELENIGGDVTINGDYSGTLHFRKLAKPIVLQSGPTEVRIERLPGELDMDLRDFRATDVVGPVSVHAKSRDVHIENLTNSLSLSVEHGDIALDLQHSPTAAIDVATGNGNVDLTLPASAAFQLSGATKSGQVTNDFGPALDVKSQGRGEVVTGTVGKGPKITLDTKLGTVSVRKQ
jgi:putative adhesin